MLRCDTKKATPTIITLIFLIFLLFFCYTVCCIVTLTKKERSRSKKWQRSIIFTVSYSTFDEPREQLNRRSAFKKSYGRNSTLVEQRQTNNNNNNNNNNNMSATIEQMMFDGQKHLPQQRSFCEDEQVGCSSMLLLCLVEQTAEQIAYEIGVDGMEDVSFREFVDLVKTTTLSNNSNSSNSNSNKSQKDSFDIELLVEHDILRDRSTSVLRRIYYSSLMNPTTSNDGNTRKENPPTTTMKEDPPTATITAVSYTHLTLPTILLV